MIIPYQNLELLSDESLEKGFFKKGRVHVDTFVVGA